VGNDEQAPALAESEEEITLLGGRVVWIGNGQ
jgi:hypothetical protein